MWPDQISNPGPLNYESGALLTALHGPAIRNCIPGKLLSNLVSEFCAHWGRRGWEGPGVGMGRETELVRARRNHPRH